MCEWLELEASGRTIYQRFLSYSSPTEILKLIGFDAHNYNYDLGMLLVQVVLIKVAAYALLLMKVRSSVQRE